jgi:nucleotide-binding universal stress UspA family protein
MERILFPVDLSKPCERTAPVVAAWARQLGAEVRLLNVGDGGNLLAFAPAAWAGLKVSGLECEGNPADEIVNYAAKNAVSLIMMPTHGATGFRQLLLGTVTTGVLQDSQLPVWTTAHSEDLVGEGEPTTVPKKILCAVDCGPETTRVVRAAQALAAKLGAELAVVHSAPRPDPRFESGLADKAHWLVKSNAQEAYQKAIPEGPALEIVEGETLVAGVVEALTARQADLLVIGRGRLQGTLGRLRTNAHALIQAAPCPVLSF